MPEKDRITIARLTEAIERILSADEYASGKIAVCGNSGNPELDRLAAKVAELELRCVENRDFILGLASGFLDVEPPRRNPFAGYFKQLHAELRHLTWQIQQIADGDYEQQVSFSGDFAAAINKMILALREREALAQQNMENQQRLVAYAEELKQLNATKDKFFSIIAHDLKNPFIALLGFSEIVETELAAGDTATAAKYARMLRQSAGQGYELLINLLDWARQQSGRITVRPEPIDLGWIICSNVDIVSLTARAKGVEVHFQSEGKEYPVVTDMSILNTILRNLIGNAIKYTPTGGCVTVSVEPKSGFLWVSVRDTGVGIKPEDMDKLFRMDAHYTTPGTNHEQGTGLGLILCKDFVHRLGGELTVESRYGEGSVFAFSLPL